MNIGLLQCDHVNPQFAHLLGDYDDAFRALFAKHAPHITLKVYDACHGVLPQSLDECEGYITTGSKHSVYEDIEWIHQLAEFVRRIHAHQHEKYVGICFGHQMLAHALGGTVAKSERGWGVGVKSATLHHNKQWMTPDINDYRLLHIHQDQVQQLPPNGEVLASNEHCDVSMFVVGDHMLGIQGHPEFIPEFVDALMQTRVERIGAETVRAARNSLIQPTNEAMIVNWIERFFTAS